MIQLVQWLNSLQIQKGNYMLFGSGCVDTYCSKCVCIVRGLFGRSAGERRAVGGRNNWNLLLPRLREARVMLSSGTGCASVCPSVGDVIGEIGQSVKMASDVVASSLTCSIRYCMYSNYLEAYNLFSINLSPSSNPAKSPSTPNHLCNVR